ncbi:MAG: type II secretion system protein [Planctomycetes bacterium]|nr:type II secretion system protein [Planctomycetota bacterium]
MTERQSHNNFAFTLIELLVVIGIIAILSTMIFIAQDRPFEEMLVGDAISLKSTLQRARSLSIGTGNSHGVVFHIENAGDGTVLKNASIHDDSNELFVGRHWYAIVGPDKESISGYAFQERRGELPPLMKNNHSQKRTFLTLTQYAAAMEKVQIGPRQYLSDGVRFLALSDLDEVSEYKTGGSGESRVPQDDVNSPASSPRPWFGYYDKVSNTLYPWGAYNRDIDEDLLLPNTGLDYEGFDGPIPYSASLDTNISPKDVWGRIHFTWDFDSDSGSGSTALYPELLTLAPWGATTYGRYALDNNGDNIIDDREIYELYSKVTNLMGPDTTHLANKPRPLVNAFWCDFMIFFQPNGMARVTTAHGRWGFINNDEWSKPARGRADMGIKFEQDKVGGFAITLCRDVDPEADEDLYTETNAITGQPAYNKFNSVEDAFTSITPFIRIHVDRFTGIADVRKNDHPMLRITADDMTRKNPYPQVIP